MGWTQPSIRQNAGTFFCFHDGMCPQIGPKMVPKWSLKGVQIAFGVEVVCGESFWEPREGVGRAFWLFGVPQMAHWDPKGAKSYLQEPSKTVPFFAPRSEGPLEGSPGPKCRFSIRNVQFQ